MSAESLVARAVADALGRPGIGPPNNAVYGNRRGGVHEDGSGGQVENGMTEKQKLGDIVTEGTCEDWPGGSRTLKPCKLRPSNCPLSSARRRRRR